MSLIFHISCRISVTFIDKDGEEKQINVPLGMSRLEAAHEKNIEFEGKGVTHAILFNSLGIVLMTLFSILIFWSMRRLTCVFHMPCHRDGMLLAFMLCYNDTDYYNKLEDPTDEENDMLDLAFGLTETSQLGCQVIAAPELDGIRLALPAATRNFAVDGYVPKPH
ncbi:hypothetical protein GIB67_008995 [Kingdonia uniflora]|uniref:Ferredoxin n=1 Tax=Kingdonia uniflora TaxID=39325 RepID=A0A7J7LVV5_9MAGN|nr:hypothetical protein GIB67_008995 [Kingdonia uniflora]